ncbi:MacB family efflux pump subunit [Zavarzinia compransoris]|uniref:Pyoverdine export ATP-binding/permease protein PvdT n=1 Tax=Zavarzinia compransoris TaxID=1264899 RepID=A0A317DZC0_9PROT|nr:MacB family efflux pump subunit [Zavarzinia compransoris]PWR18235.1 macrolide ABC transporter permease/ATP-binding protein MacB [Zavarzinia compransoris]TDP40871.1 macrolide transport system ATP-binding/permease protein [Zavarzinia compransoris]
MAAPLIEIRGLRRSFAAGEEEITVLRDVDLTIERGEMVAIIGASGSGKSTLMNILGCLDRPTAGTYRINGRETSSLDADELAHLRREYFGFIFQRYHLLSDLDAAGNAEVPAVYAGTSRAARRERAVALLKRLGLGERLGHRPGQLSGGQQQRVSVARALMNGGQVILADEPTGALDRASGQDMLKLLRELHQQGHTVIIVTHDMAVAEIADRRIEISDGQIVGDWRRPPAPIAGAARDVSPPDTSRATPPAAPRRLSGGLDRFEEAFRMALRAMVSHKLRTFLTMLGIIIGIASVVSVVALGEGSKQRILQDISSIGTNTVEVFPGKGFGDRDSARIQTLVAADAEALAKQPFVDSATPSVSSTMVLLWRNQALSVSVNGVGDQFFRVKGYAFAAGRGFDAAEVRRNAQLGVIDSNMVKKLFPNGETALGEVIIVGNVPVRIVGVLDPVQSSFGSSDTLKVYIPYTSAQHRILGQSYLQSISVRIDDSISSDAAEQGVIRLLTRRHGTQDFFIVNTDTIRQTIQQTTETMTVLISMIAVIALVVGGIGVMNIMLVSVTERTKEIGVRMAVGARQGDIMRQFMIEAVVVCLVGGVLGIAAALAFGYVFGSLSTQFRLVFSADSIVAAVGVSTVIGVVFGFLPARSAARLDPVDALSRE